VEVACIPGDLSLASTMDDIFACAQARFDNRVTAFVHNAGCWVGLTSVSESQPDPRDFEEAWKYYHGPAVPPALARHCAGAVPPCSS
jgi:hypothetical protein